MIRPLLWSLAGATLISVTLVLPATYGVDPTGLGKRLGLVEHSEASQASSATEGPIILVRTPTGFENYSLPERDDTDEPIPLPDPSVYHEQTDKLNEAALSITLKAGQQTEIKLLAAANDSIVFEWESTSAELYTDFHGHLPDDDDFWVRYQELEDSSVSRGSLLIPFTGEHGWYWLNIGEDDLTITLKVYGHYDELIDYGITDML